jgi:hypothetical protein
VTAFLVDEMFPPDTAYLLREKYGHDAVHVFDVGLQGADDADVAEVARAEGRAVVTENVGDFAAEHGLVLVFLLKTKLPTRSAQALALAAALDRWAQENPKPYLGPHWPQV